MEAHHGERIVPSEINKYLMGISNEALPGLLSLREGNSAAELQLLKQIAMQSAYGNKLLRGGLRWVDHDGSIVDAEGNKKKYIN